MYKIGEFSNLSKITVRMLRHYDEVGLLLPVRIDDFTGYRYYSSSQLLRARSIIEYRDMGFNISEISILLNSEDSFTKDMLLNKMEEVKASIDLENYKLKLMENKIYNLGKEIKMENNVEVKMIPSVDVISLRGIIPNHNAEGQLWEKLEIYAQENSVELTSDVHTTGVTIYHDIEWKQNDCDTEVVMKTKEMRENDDDIVFKKMDAIPKAACIIVEGSYDKLREGYAIIAQWIEENNHTICGSCRQVSIKHPNNENDPSKFLTEIQIPIK